MDKNKHRPLSNSPRGGENRWRKGLVIVGLLLMVGLALQLLLGAVDWSLLAWPVNGYALAAFVLIIILAHVFRHRLYVLRYLSTLYAAVPAIGLAVVLTIVMGLIRQDGTGGWLSDVLSFWPFVLSYVYVAFILGLVTLRRAGQCLRSDTLRLLRHDLPFLLNHIGLFLALVCGTLGNADVQRLKMVTSTEARQWHAVDEEMHVVEMPMAIELKRFIMETYDNGEPRRFASDIEIVTRTGEEIQATVDVNHPLKVDGWKIYQFGYDTAMGAESETSVLELVRDPWQPAVLTGILMMLSGAVFLFVGGRRKEVAS